MTNKYCEILLHMPNLQKTDEEEIKPSLYNVHIALLNSPICRYMAKFDNSKNKIIFLDSENDDSVIEYSEHLLIEIRMRLEAMYSFQPISQDIMRDSVTYIANLKQNQIN